MTTERVLGGRYRVGAVIGHGGMAEVHRGRDVRLGRDVAIKLLRSDLARDPSFHGRFRREAQSAASLNHPSIVAVYDTGEDHGGQQITPFIVMEYVEGRTLRDVVATDGRLSTQRALEITSQICAALEQAHRAGIVHRDVKPGNVMLTPDGEVKVMDFGIARAVTGSSATMTQTAAVIGTAQYLSPEQARGEHVDARSDIYSTGCLLYELVTGAPPFTGDTPVSVAYQHVREDPVPPSRVEPDVPPAVDAIVLKAMAKNPANRYQTAAEMRADLERALAGQPVEAAPVLTEDTAHLLPPPATTVLLRQPPQRRGRAVAYVALGVAAIVVFLLALLLASNLLKNNGGDVNTPSVIGLALPDAQALLQAKGLHTGKVTPAYDNSGKYAKGEVMAQDPQPDILLSKGQSVDLTVSQGIQLVVVPDLVGLTQAEAKKVLSAAHLKVGQIVPQNSDQPPGQVLAADPLPGQQVAINSAVNLTVSNGMVQVPKVVGMTVDKATQTLQAAGFQVQLTPATSPGNAHVVSQNPAAGSFAQYGTTTVTLQTDAPPPTPTQSPTPTPSSTDSTPPTPTPSGTPT